MEKQKLMRIFDNQASQYENKREGVKLRMMRQQLLRHANGEVLELAVGTGANFPFYPLGVKVTAIDFSHAMIAKAERRARQLQVNAKFICSDIEEMNFEDHTFNTVVSTLSLCSYANPLMLLSRINRWCKPDGEVLLLEHGVSSNPIISTLQKSINPLYHRVYGCHQTRNILELIQESGMNIITADSSWMNTVHLVRLKPNN